MTTILSLPACAAPPAARQPDTTLDPAAGDPFAAALAAALTAGLAGAQPAPPAPLTHGAPAPTCVSSDDGAAVTDSSLAAGGQSSGTTVAHSPPGTLRTPAPIAGGGATIGAGIVASLAPAAAADGAVTVASLAPAAASDGAGAKSGAGIVAFLAPAAASDGTGAKLGAGTVASLAPANVADGGGAKTSVGTVAPLAPVERGPLPLHQPTEMPAEPAPGPSGLAASPVPAPRQRPATAPRAPSAEAASDDVTAAWTGRDAVTVERVVRGAAGRAPAPAASARPSGGRAPDVAGGIETPPPVTADRPATAPAAPPSYGGAARSLNASGVAAPPAITPDGPAIERPVFSRDEEPAEPHEEELDALIGLAVRRLAARVAGEGQSKRGGAEGVAAIPARWTPATEGDTPVPSAVPAAAAMADSGTPGAGSEVPVEGTPTAVGDDGARPQLRLIKFPATRSRLGRPTSPAPADASGAREGGAPASSSPSPIRRTTRSGDLRVAAPRSEMAPVPSAPAPASALGVPAAPALSGAASMTEPASPPAPAAPEPLAPPPAPTDRVTLRIGGDDGGDATRVWVSVRGDTVHARITSPDAPAAAALTAALGELQSALERHGFTEASLRVLVPAPGPTDGRAAPPAAPAAVDVAAATTPSRGTDAPSDGNLSGRQRGQDTATDRQGHQGSRPHQRSPRERER